MKKQSEATTLQSWWFATGNIANNLIFMFITMFMMYFFTNVTAWIRWWLVPSSWWPVW